MLETSVMLKQGIKGNLKYKEESRRSDQLASMNH